MCVPKIKGKGLMLSIIPGDIWKAAARLEIALVVEEAEPLQWSMPFTASDSAQLLCKFSNVKI